MKRDLLLLLSALVALTSCSKDDVVTTTDPQTTQISFTTEIKTRVSGSSFEAGDAVSVYAFDGATQYASAEYTYADSKFSSTNPITYIGDDEKSLSYTAVYPTVDDLAFSFEISGDQSKDENYYASDLLVANVAATTSAEPKLSFYHKMSSIVLNISVTQNGEAVTAGSSVEMYALNNVDCNAITDSYVATGSTTTITPAANGTSGYKFIIAPQDVKAGESFATLTVGDVTFDWIESKDLNFLSGNEYNYTWKVDLESKVSTITFEGMINDWNSGNDIDIVGGSNTEDDSALSIVLEGGNGMASSDETGTFETEGVTFAYYNACYNTYGSYAVNKNTDGYICNATALEGLSEVILTDDYSYFNFSLYVGSEAGVCTQKIEYTQEDGSDDRVFTIPEGYSFFTLVNETTYDANADKITILFESLGETSTVTPPTTEEPDEPEVDDTKDGIFFDGSELPTTYPTDATITVGGIDFTINSVANFNGLGPIQFKKSESYIYNTTAIANLTEVIITLAPAGTTYNNFTIYVGSSVNPTETVIEPTRTDDVCSYIIPEGSTFVTIANISNYATYAFDIEFVTEKATPETLVLEGGNGMASSDETGTFETEGVTFAYYNACYNTYGSYAVNKNTDGYICNATALEGLSEVILTDDYSYFNFSLYVGSEAGVCTQKIEYTQEDGSDDRVFTIPEGYSFFTLVNETTYDANADKITILFESLGETSTVTPPATEEPEPADPNQYTCDSFLAAMGKTTDDINSSSGLNIVDAEFDNFTFTSDKGTATTAFRLWTDLTIRSYAGNTVTVTAKDGKMVKSIVFSASEISEATEGTADGKSWSGESSTVTLTLTKATNDSITIVVE